MKRFLLANACIFFLFFTALVLLVFVAGNVQGFAPSSLFLLLGLLRFSAFLCIAAAAARLFYLVFAALSKQPSSPPRPRDFVFTLFCLVFGLAVLAVSQFILGLTLPKF